jgi:hypothetical protein
LVATLLEADMVGGFNNFMKKNPALLGMMVSNESYTFPGG